jgi:hypothetical protein
VSTFLAERTSSFPALERFRARSIRSCGCWKRNSVVIDSHISALDAGLCIGQCMLPSLLHHDEQFSFRLEIAVLRSLVGMSVCRFNMFLVCCMVNRRTSRCCNDCVYAVVPPHPSPTADLHLRCSLQCYVAHCNAALLIAMLHCSLQCCIAHCNATLLWQNEVHAAT